MSNEVDAFVQTKLDPRYGDIVARLRSLFVDEAPAATECLTYGSPAWRGTRMLAVISQSKTHLTFAFERGAEFTDSHGLLEGVGKKTRHVKLRPGHALNDAALRDYIKQAVRLDAQG